MDKKGQKGLGWPVVVLIIAALFLFYTPITNLIAPKPATPATPDGAAVIAPGVVCPVDVTTLGFSAKSVDDPGTVVRTGMRYWIAGNPQGVINSTSQSTVSPGDTVEVLFGIADSTYYASHFDSKATVPCKGTYDVPGKLWTKDTSVSMIVYNTEGFAQPGDGSAYNQTMGVGDEKILKFKVTGNYQKYFGNPDVTLNNLMVFDYSRTKFKKVALLKDGAEQPVGAVPVQHSITTGNAASAYQVAKVAGSGEVLYQVRILADSVLNPDTSVVATMYDADYFYNSLTGKVEMGYEDQNSADVGVASEPTATIYIN
jgi:hypothetical protein